MASTFNNRLNCYICGQQRPCCRQALHDLISGRRKHQKIVRKITGKLAEKWTCGSVYATCCNAIYGEYFDIVYMTRKTVFLGNTEEQALARVNIVKANVM